MPLAPEAPEGAPDTSEFSVMGPMTAARLPADEGTGALSPKYAALDTWAAAARTSILGRTVENITQMRATAYNPLAGGKREQDIEPLIPEDMLPYKDKYAGLYTPEEVLYKTQQIKQELSDRQVLGASKWGNLGAMAFGVSDPVSIASMAVPVAGATRLATALRLGLVGAGVSAVDELVLHQMDPLATFEGSAVNIGAGTLLSGLLGAAIKPRVPAAELERLRANLQADLEHPGVPTEVPAADSHAAVAADLRKAIDQRAEDLATAAETEKAGAAALVPEEVQQRLESAQQRALAAGQPLEPEARQAALSAEAERLAQPEEVATRLREQYGDRVGQVLLERAEATIAEQEAAREAERAAAQQEVETAQADQQRLQRATETQQARQEFAASPPERAARDVETHVFDQLQAVGRFEEPVNRSYAQLVGRFYQTQAARLGMTPGELFTRHPLNVAGAASGNALMQELRPPFYSAAIRAIENHPQARASAEQWAKTLDNMPGIKREELDWMGVPQWLKTQSGPITREELLAHMRANEVKVEDVALGMGRLDSAETLSIRQWLEEHGDLDVMDPTETENLDDLLARAGHGDTEAIADLEGHGVPGDLLAPLYDPARRQGEEVAGAPKFDRYQMPGGKNYRELLLTLPYAKKAVPEANILAQAKADADFTENAKDAWQSLGPNGRQRYIDAARARFERTGKEFRAGHWDQPNVLAHVRTNERIDADGKRVLHIEEIQSDWHQRGRQAGYREPPPPVQEIRGIQGDEHQWFAVGMDGQPLSYASGSRAAVGKGVVAGPTEAHEYISRVLNKERAEAANRIGAQVPNAPFKKTWPELTLKRMIRYAAENGFDRITWTTGAQQADRYNLRKQIERVQLHDNVSGGIGPAKLEGPMNGASVTAFDKSGRKVISKNVASEHELAELIGKEAADRLLASAPQQARDAGLGVRQRELSGADLEVGGEGMKGFYDKILPAAANKLGKKFGATVGETKIVTGEAARNVEGQMFPGSEPTQTVHSMDITPELRDAALGGQPLFQEGRGMYMPEASTIALLPHADLSTFLHESGHHFLDILGSMATQADAPLSIQHDMVTLLKWFGIKDLDQWHGLGLEGQRQHHEQFARGFEAYLKNGTAPSTALQSLFDKFREWLVNIYQGLKGEGFTPEVKSVMDRMLATETEIQAARQARVAAAPTPTLKRVAGDEVLRDTLRHMAENETGWAEVGGRMTKRAVTPIVEGGLETGSVGNEFEVGRTAWVPNAEWWPGRPGSYSPEEVSNTIGKALRGERLGPKQQRLVEYMSEVADARVAQHPYLPSDTELAETMGSVTLDDAYKGAMVARLRQIDEDGVENLARRFEDDDSAFMRAVKERLDAYDEDAKIARTVPQDSEPHGDAPNRPATGGAAGEEGGAGRQPEATPAGAAAGDTTGVRQPAVAPERGAGDQTLAPPSDITELLAKLPEADRTAFIERLNALERPSAPIISNPSGESTAGAASALRGEPGMQEWRLARGGRVLGAALGWFAPGSRLLRSPSLAVRKLVIDLAETPEMLEANVPTRDKPWGIPTPPAVETKLKLWEGKWMQGFRAREEQYRAYRGREPLPGEPEKFGKHQFNEEVTAAMRRGDQHPIAEVAKAAQDTRRLVFDPLQKEAVRLGLLNINMETLRGTAESYMMRQYDRAKIRAERGSWHQLLRDGFIEQGIDSAEADDVAHKVTRNLLGAERGLLDLNDVVFRDVVPTSGRLIERKILLPDTLLEKYLVNDIDHLSHSYLKSLAPQVEVTKAFGDKDLQGAFKNVTDEYALMTQRALAENDNHSANLLNDRLRADLRDLGAMRDRLYGIFGMPSDPTGWMQRAARVIRSVNAFRMLGTATWSHLPDAANVVMKYGLPQTMAASMKLATSLQALKLNRDEIQRLGSAIDMVHNSTAAQLGEFGVDSNYALQKMLNRGTRAFTIATLEIPWIATCKALGGALAHDEILKSAEWQVAGGKLGTNERIRLNQLGIGYFELERIADQFRQHGTTVNGLRFGMSDKWTDPGAAQALETAVNKAAEATTLSPSKGDTPLWTSSEVGKSIFQFKTFGAVAVRKVLIPLAQGLSHGDLRSAQGLATLIAAGAMTYTVKQMLSGQPIEKNPERYALEVLDKSNLLGWTGELFYPLLWQGGMENFSRWGDRQTWETLGGPVAGTAVDLWDLRIPAKIRGQMTGDPNDSQFTRRDIHRIRRMLPANQVWYLRRAVNALEGNIGDMMGLPPEPPRGSTE